MSGPVGVLKRSKLCLYGSCRTRPKPNPYHPYCRGHNVFSGAEMLLDHNSKLGQATFTKAELIGRKNFGSVILDLYLVQLVSIQFTSF